MYSLLFRSSVQKDVRSIPQAIHRHIKEKINGLQENPFPAGCIALEGYTHVYRLRFSHYRILYEVNTKQNIVTIIGIRHRSTSYRNL
jgi:mRNA interferase RelE/StbE